MGKKLSRGQAVLIIFAAVVITVIVLMTAERAAHRFEELDYAPAGELALGFPKELILGQKPVLSNSYSISYEDNLKQFTASLSLEESMVSLFGLYKEYFRQNGWRVTNEITKYAVSRGIYATKDSLEVSVAIVDQGGQREVIVSYLQK